MLVGGKGIVMDSEAEQSTGMSGQIEDLIVDLGNDRFMTRHEALNKLRDMLPSHERAIATELVRWIQLYGKSDAGSSASYVNKAAMDLFQGMTEMGLEPLINEGLAAHTPGNHTLIFEWPDEDFKGKETSLGKENEGFKV